MIIRVLLAAALAVSIASPASAQPSAKDRIKRLQTQAPANGEAQRPVDPALAPLASLPQLPGATWREWIIPPIDHSIASVHQSIRSFVQMVNISNASVSIEIECYKGSATISTTISPRGNRNFKKNSTIDARGTRTFEYKEGWCRVSADHPIMVSINKVSRESVFNPQKPNNARYGIYDSKVIPAIPYPAH